MKREVAEKLPETAAGSGNFRRVCPIFNRATATAEQTKTSDWIFLLPPAKHPAR